MRYKDIIDTDKTLVKYLFCDVSDYFEVIDKLSNNIIDICNNLDKDKYYESKENVWIGKNVKIDSSATIEGVCIIDDNTVIKRGAYLRGNTIIGKNCVIGNNVEIKNSIIFDDCSIAHFNYVGDSILGYKVHLSAGVILSNLKSDESNIYIKDGNDVISTKLRKLGSLVGNYVNIGCNSVANPGTIIGSNTNIYPLVRVRGVIPSNSIMKDEDTIIKKEM